LSESPLTLCLDELRKQSPQDLKDFGGNIEMISAYREAKVKESGMNVKNGLELLSSFARLAC
jgi:hypothetical protein